MGLKKKVEQYESAVFRQLLTRYKIKELCRHLNTSHKGLYMLLSKPSQYMTIDKMFVVSGLMDKSIYEVFGLLMGLHAEESRTWHDRSGGDMPKPSELTQKPT